MPLRLGAQIGRKAVQRRVAGATRGSSFLQELPGLRPQAPLDRHVRALKEYAMLAGLSAAGGNWSAKSGDYNFVKRFTGWDILNFANALEVSICVIRNHIIEISQSNRRGVHKPHKLAAAPNFIGRGKHDCP
jgi:hypothetical protein